MSGTIAVVSPRFGAGVVGGAEALLREIATGLAGRGWAVEVLTTCATDHYTWANDLPPGPDRVDGLAVTRFETVSQHAPGGLEAQLAIQADRVPPLDEQVSWLSWRFSVPGLFEHLLRHGDRYGAVLFAPYLFWTTSVCLPLVADRAVSLPCLHDETYARLDVVAPALSDPARVWFLSEPEHRLAHRLRPLPEAHCVVGAGMDTSGSYDAERFRRRYGITRPFLLYAGRREEGKGWDWLVDTYTDAVAHHGLELDLVSVGVGDCAIPPTLRGRLLDLGVVSDQDRDDAVAAAVAYVQPSLMESFSRTVMESWLAGTPVLARRGGQVVSWHVERSGGGATFADAASLAEAASSWAADPAQAAALGARGRQYVLDNYTWPVVLDRMEADLRAMGLDRKDRPAPPPLRAAGRPVLIVGNYPPVPTAGSEAALGAARQVIADGDDPVVASPRPSAAALTVSVVGPLAGRRLDQLRVATGATRLVLCAEADLPVPVTGYPRWALPAVQRRTVRSLVDAFGRFDEVTLVRCGDLRLPGALADALGAAASRTLDHLPASPTPPGVSVRGPSDPPLRELVRSATGALDRRVLRRAPAARRALVGVARRARTLRS
jgi:glycosyltransferase involved in cell wall biosynthesis